MRCRRICQQGVTNHVRYGSSPGSLKTLKLKHRSYKKEYDRRVCVAPIFRIGNYVSLDRLSVFCSATEPSASEGYNKLPPRKQGHYNFTGVNKNALQSEQSGLENTVPIH